MEISVDRIEIDPNWGQNVDFSDFGERVGPPVVEAARRYVRVDTGQLRDSLDYETQTGGDGLPETRIGSNEEHALPNELGTVNMSAQPYLRPALDSLESGL